MEKDFNGPQIFSQPITTVIRNRCSVRTYVETPLSSEHKTQLAQYINELQSQADVKMRIKLVESDVARREKGARLGTYGIIKGASSYIVSTVDQDFTEFEFFGYWFEKLILYATSLGLGTCWMALTFNHDSFQKSVELSEQEILPVITPVGYPSNKFRPLDTIVRMTVRARSRKDWQEIFLARDFNHPLNQSEAGPYANALEMLRLSPSAENHQPWRVVKDNDTFHFYLQRTKNYRNKYEYDIQRVDVGIAMCHFDLTLMEQGIKGSWSCNDPCLGIESPELVYIKSWERG